MDSPYQRGGVRHSAGIRLIVVLLEILVVLSVFWADNAKSQSKPIHDRDQHRTQSLTYRNADPGVAYVGSKACAACHSDIYAQYKQSVMGQSALLADEFHPPGEGFADKELFDQHLDRHFRVFRTTSGTYEGEYAVGPDGKEIFNHTEKLEYAIGAGLVGYSFIIRKDGYLFQAPLSYYMQSSNWGLSPGYEVQDIGFGRGVTAECVQCHTGRPQPVAGHEGSFKDPPFFELAIGCENCHGPGGLHVRERQKGLSLDGPVDRSIVNPAKLSPWLADNICMSCHQSGDARVLQNGRNYTDFRPGEELNETIAIFKAPLSRQSPDASPLLDHYYSMVISKCYERSGHRLSCLSCHDPHVNLSADKVVNFYRAKCLQCHTEKSCGVDLRTRIERPAGDDCAGCHMPKQTVKTIAHSMLTNHRIIRVAGEPFPENAFIENNANPELIHINAPPEREDRISDLAFLEAYRGALLHNRLEYKDEYFALLQSLANKQPDNPLVLSFLAQKAISEGQSEQALNFASQAIQRGSKNVEDFLLLGEVLAQAGRVPEAIEILKRGSRLSPYNYFFYESLAVKYISIGMNADAQKAIDEGLERFPEDMFLLNLKKKIVPEETGMDAKP